jgi:hypothetical protein
VAQSLAAHLLVRDFLARIPADMLLERAILYRSRARGEHRPDQPVTIAIEDWLNPAAFPRLGFLRNVAREGIVL